MMRTWLDFHRLRAINVMRKRISALLIAEIAEVKASSLEVEKDISRMKSQNMSIREKLRILRTDEMRSLYDSRVIGPERLH